MPHAGRRPLALPDVIADLRALRVRAGQLLMVHSSLASLGHVLGGAPTVVRALLAALGPDGTLVMPAFSPEVSDPERWPDRPFPDTWLAEARAWVPAFDAATTPTSMGAIPECFRRWPGTLRSAHPQVSVAAHGPLGERIVAPHGVDWGQGAGSPFERLVELDGLILLLGVGFNRVTLLHYAESRVPHGRRKLRRIPVGEGDTRGWIEAPDVGDDLNTHFPAIGDAFLATGAARQGRVGEAATVLAPARALVDVATAYLDRVLERPR